MEQFPFPSRYMKIVTYLTLSTFTIFFIMLLNSLSFIQFITDLCTMYNLQCTMYNAHCTMYSVHCCTLYCYVVRGIFLSVKLHYITYNKLWKDLTVNIYNLIECEYLVNIEYSKIDVWWNIYIVLR